MLDIGQTHLTLSAPDGSIVLQWSPAGAAQGIRFPSFSKSIKYVGFLVPGGGMYEFSIGDVYLKQLRDFANRGIAASGSGAVSAVLRNAILTCLGGLLALGVGIASLYRTVIELSGNAGPGGRSVHPTGVVTTLLGVAILCRGVYGLYQYVQLKKIASAQIQSPTTTSVPPPLPKQ